MSAGGRASVLGVSSSAAFALEAARAGAPIDRLAVYEAPFNRRRHASGQRSEAAAGLQELVDAGRPGDAVKLFMRTVGVPAPFIVLMRLMPVWKKLVGVAHTPVL
jgi:hypothetical protein